MIYTSHYESALGGITLAGNEMALIGLWFDGQKHFGATLPEEYKEKDLPIFEQTVHWMDLYFSGEVPGFLPPIEVQTTPFRRAVWEILLTIPYGQTMTYGEIAERIGYNSADHFSRVFRSAYKMSPQEYRKQHKDEEPAFVPFAIK